MNMLVLLAFSMLGLVSGAAFYDPTNSCPKIPADIVMVIDTSVSISATQMIHLKVALAYISKLFDVGPAPQQIHIAAVGFAGKGEKLWGFTDYLDSYQLEGAFLNMRRATQTSGSETRDFTHTHAGLEEMLKLFESHGARPYARQVSIVVTDGRTTQPGKLWEVLNYLHLYTNIVQFAVGVGDLIDPEELSSLTNYDEGRTFAITDYHQLNQLATDLSEVACTCAPVCKRGQCNHQTATCECPPQWTGEVCDDPVCHPACGSHGTCDTNTFRCACNDHWQGQACDQPICSPMCVHGQCDPYSLTCSCDEGYQGEDCGSATPTAPPPEPVTTPAPPPEPVTTPATPHVTPPIEGGLATPECSLDVFQPFTLGGYGCAS